MREGERRAGKGRRKGGGTRGERDDHQTGSSRSSTCRRRWTTGGRTGTRPRGCGGQGEGGGGGGGTADRSRGGANELRHPPPPSRRAATGSAAVPGGRGGGVARTTHGHLYNHQDYSYQKGRRGGPRRCGTGPPFPPPPSSSPSPSAKRKKKTRDQPINSARGPATPPQPGGAVSDTRPTCNAKRKPQVLRSSGSAGSWPHAAGARW